jgi:hypothetical protein
LASVSASGEHHGLGRNSPACGPHLLGRSVKIRGKGRRAFKDRAAQPFDLASNAA